MCSLVRKSPPNVEKIARFPGGEKAQNPVTSLAVMVFLGPECGLNRLKVAYSVHEEGPGL